MSAVQSDFVNSESKQKEVKGWMGPYEFWAILCIPVIPETEQHRMQPIALLKSKACTTTAGGTAYCSSRKLHETSCITKGRSAKAKAQQRDLTA